MLLIIYYYTYKQFFRTDQNIKLEGTVYGGSYALEYKSFRKELTKTDILIYHIFYAPTEWEHIALHLSVRVLVRTSFRPSVRP
jgi:hypothetical protein